jgi:hypothetical protein
MKAGPPLLVFFAVAVDGFTPLYVAGPTRPLSRASVPLASHPELPGASHWDPLGLETAVGDGAPLLQGGAVTADQTGDQKELECLVAALLLASSLTELVHAAPAMAAEGGGAAGVAGAAGASVLTGQQIFEKAAKKALGGGLSGAAAGVFQVLLLMWLRTTMNYQYRNGGATLDAMAALYKEGGLRRFYRGVSFALFQTPLSRFGDTAANSGILALLATSDLPVGLRTAAASGAASLWRIGLTPIDTMKTSLQVWSELGVRVVADAAFDDLHVPSGRHRWWAKAPPSRSSRRSKRTAWESFTKGPSPTPSPRLPATTRGTSLSTR